MKRKGCYLFAMLLWCSFFMVPSWGQSTIKVTVDKIWDQGTHAAFTSLVKFNGKYYCTFREGYSHIFDDKGNAEGKVRILESTNGKQWKSVACFGKEGIDLRDPKLSVTPDNRLMVTIGGSVYRNRQLVKSIPMVCFSDNGRQFTDPEPIVIDEKVRSDFDWMWRVTWFNGVGYGVNYSKDGFNVSLLKTTDGVHYDLITELGISGSPNETTLRFLPDGRMMMMVRREAGDCTGYWGVSAPPYTDWRFESMGFRLGGPDFHVVDEQNLIVGTRSYVIPSHCKTVLYRGDVKGNWEEIYVLPSKGDTSYPGFLVEGNEVWVSYYASTDKPDKSAIYLAKLPLSLFVK